MSTATGKRPTTHTLEQPGKKSVPNVWHVISHCDVNGDVWTMCDLNLGHNTKTAAITQYDRQPCPLCTLALQLIEETDQ